MGLYQSSYQFGWLFSTFTKGIVIGLIYISVAMAVNSF